MALLETGGAGPLPASKLLPESVILFTLRIYQSHLANT
jgi:hypothetical protein